MFLSKCYVGVSKIALVFSFICGDCEILCKDGDKIVHVLESIMYILIYLKKYQFYYIHFT